ncbi:MAG: hypothetical protein V1708_04750 [Candidatus Micrarchaeota archaeon]
MEISFSRREIVLDREEFAVDRFARKFAAELDALKIRYVFISGYVAIAFGRSRSTEDVDVIVEKIPFSKFETLWQSLSPDFDCINAPSAKAAYEEYLLNGTAIRFALKGQFIPNVEFKFPKDRWDEHSLENRVKLVLNGAPLFISPLELQIAYKCYLGSDKDIEDAVYLFEVLKQHIDLASLSEFLAKFNIPKQTIDKLGVKRER